MNKPIQKYAVRNIADIHGKTKLSRIGIIIPAAGCGNRTKYLGTKSLLYINNVPLIDRQLDTINKVFNKKDIVLVTGFEAEKVLAYTKNYNIIRVENENYNKTNISRSISIGLKTLHCDSILIIYGDLFFNKELIDLSYKKESFVVCCNTMSENEIGYINNNNNILENLFYELPNKWAQVVYLVGEELKTLEKIVHDRSNDNLFGYEIINKIVDSGGKFKTIIPKNGYCQDIDNNKDYITVQNKYA